MKQLLKIIFFSLILIININSLDKTNTGPVIDLEKLNDYFFGTSLVAKEPVRLISMYSGVVYEINEDQNNNRNLGKYVIIQHKVKNTKISFFLVYCLLSEIKVKEGNIIKKGDVVGLTGPSGPIKDKIKDISVIVGIYTLTKDNELDKIVNSESGFMHNAYWYNPDDFNLNNDKVD